jgi:hypothetical protein
VNQFSDSALSETQGGPTQIQPIGRSRGVIRRTKIVETFHRQPWKVGSVRLWMIYRRLPLILEAIDGSLAVSNDHPRAVGTTGQVRLISPLRLRVSAPEKEAVSR